ncbi:MAG: NAD(P)-binding domain-containing protein [Planctomycetes bacterium]|nr:NAD(P)-binding domain-containing protein [Planctomycetota bacterium]
MREHVDDRERAVRAGSEKAQLQHPVIDLSRCLGCGKCVTACPEEGVLALVHGQAVVVNGARCTGVAACERECPVGAIQVTLTDLEERRDVPALTAELEAVGTPGVFLAGEVTAHALIKTAIEHGTAVAAAVARRAAPRGIVPTRTSAAMAFAARTDRGVVPEAWSAAHAEAAEDVHDLVIVGAGPAGLACALEARRRGLDAVILDQDASLGGTVAKYPRRKLVLTQPVELPLHGRLERATYTKEELIELWTRIAEEHALAIRHGERLLGLERDAAGVFTVRTASNVHRARNVCLAIGRRGTPVELGIPGERLQKVAYGLIDAQAYQGRRVLVVGGGDSAVETALALAEQPGNEVTLSYRRESFFRVRARNERRLGEAVAAGRVRVLLASRVLGIQAASADLEVDGAVERIANDDVFVLAGGVAPFPLLERAGVSFDPALRPKPRPIEEQGTGLARALLIGFGLSLAALAWALANADYYALPMEARPQNDKHLWLRPGLGLGLALGLASTALVVVNLLYIARRAKWWKLRFGTLRGWTTSHVATGVLALLCATLHGGMAPRDTVGGHALWAMIVLFVSGAIGRYFYAWVPRAANGRELELGELKLRLEKLGDEFDPGQRAFVERVRAEIERSIDRGGWRSGFLDRVAALVLGGRAMRRTFAELARAGRAQGLTQGQVEDTLAVARETWRVGLAAAHHEDLRALVNTWRYAHRWVALLLVVLVVVHVFNALVYGEMSFTGGLP